MRGAFRRACLLAVVACAAAVLVVQADAGFSSTDPSLCRDGGWRHPQTGSGEFFRNERSCVRYVTHGGTLFFPTVTAFSWCGGGSLPLWNMEVFVSGFNPSNAYSITFVEVVYRQTGSHTKDTFITDPWGADERSIEITTPPGDGFVTVIVRDARGVQATTQAPPNCP